MKYRCDSPDCDKAKWYAQRGISYCRRWASFANFLADMGERPAGTSIDRINNDKGYSPKNCRWATKKEQARNSSQATTYTFDGKTMCLAAWAEKCGMRKLTLRARIERGWSIRRTLTEPLHA